MNKPRKLAVYLAATLTSTLVAAMVAQAPALATGSSEVYITVDHKPMLANGGTLHLTGFVSMAVWPAQTESLSVSRTTRLGTTQLADVTFGNGGGFAFDDKPDAAGTVTYSFSYAGDDDNAPATGSANFYEQPVAYDFNGDGYAEGVAGSDGEALGSLTDAGTFYTFPGSAAGISATGSASYSQDSTNVPGTAEKDDFFGFTQASADFNGDGYADLVVSAPDEAIGSVKDSGSVTVFYGSATGLTTTGSFSIDGPTQSGGYFGQSLAVGDFDGDGTEDLAVGRPGTNNAVFFYRDLSKSHSTSASYKATLEAGDEYGNTLFGFSMSAGDINGDGITDLAIGAPYDYNDRGYSTGSVMIAYGQQYAPYWSQRWSLDSAGIKGVPATFGTDLSDEFGWQVALGDYNGDGKADLAVSAPGAPVTNTSGKHEDAGTVSILFSDGSQISDNDLYLTEDTAGIVGSPGKNDGFGSTLAAGDANGDGKADLAIFADGHYVEVIPGGGTTGLDTGHTVGWTQDSTGVPGSDEAGDEWGASLRFESFKGTGPQGLLIGAPGENSDEGAITVLYGTVSGLTGTGSKAFGQDTTGVPGTAEKGDLLGTFF